jgi:hypothetical protein
MLSLRGDTMSGDVAAIAPLFGPCCSDCGGLMLARGAHHLGDEIVMDA